jgi:putative SOS response-associated peptidase YedK
MCGRFAQKSPRAKITKQFKVEEVPPLAERLLPLLRPYPREEMATYAVSLMVNSPSNDTPRCVEPVSGN